MFETNPTESSKFPGYYAIEPGNSICVTPRGDFINEDTGQRLTVYFPDGSDKYPVIKVTVRGTCNVHRLLAIVFLKCPGNVDDFIVNHKNGIKTDFRLDNLEWFTYSENIIHAYETGLRTDNKLTLVKDLETGEIKEFYSLQATSRFLNVNASILHNYIHNNKGKSPFKLKWEVIYKGSEWSGLGTKDVGRVPKGAPSSMVTVCQKTKLVTLYESQSQMAEMLGIKVGTIYHWVKQNRSARKYGLDVYMAGDFKRRYNEKTIDLNHLPVPDKPHPAKNNMTKRQPVRIKVTDTITGTMEEYDSVRIFANKVNVKRSTIQRSMWKKNGKWGKFNITYID